MTLFLVRAQGDLLIFIDADILVTPEAVRAAVEVVRSVTIGGGCALRDSGRIPAYLKVFVPNVVWFAQRMRIAFGCFLFCTRAAFEAVGGFDTTLCATEEVTLSFARWQILDSFVGRPLRHETAARIVQAWTAPGAKEKSQ